MEEIWKDIEGYEGLYQVSNLGRVKSLNYRKKRIEKILRPRKNSWGYLSVALYKNGIKSCRINRLVCYHFNEVPQHLKEIPIEELQVDHLDTNRKNNVYTNLRWCTPKENNNNLVTRLNLSKALKNNEKTSKKVLQFNLDGSFIKKWDSIMEVERKTNFNRCHISRCCNGGFYSNSRGKWINVKQSHGYLWLFENKD